LPDTPGAIRTSIPMKGFTESLNVASAAAIAMYHFAGNI
jgi:tRNA G18 (ribose-2'-O)-methylase SpoU